MNYKWIIKAAGIEFIGGKYEGMNSEMEASGKTKRSDKENFVIYQSLLKTSISGVSIDSTNEEFHSMWKGDLIDRKDNIYNFSVEVESPTNKHFGIMYLRIEGGDIVGFVDYFSSGKASFKEKIVAKRIS